MQSSYHWQILATDIANEINTTLILNDYSGTPVYVRQTCGNENESCKPLESTTFDESFRDLLITKLVALGVPTSSAHSDDAIIINYKAQPVYHSRSTLKAYKPGLLTALTAGIVVLRNAPAELLAIATAGAIDYAGTYYSGVSNFEVIITTSMITKGNYLYRNSNIYYINDHDSWHYQTPASPTEISLTSSSVPPIPVAAKKEPVITSEPNPIILAPKPDDTTGI